MNPREQLKFYAMIIGIPLGLFLVFFIPFLLLLNSAGVL